LKPEYIFVVGCFHSGTTLLRNVLDNSEKISFIRAETKFFGGFLRSKVRHHIRKFGNLLLDANIQKFVDDIYSEARKGTKGLYGWLRTHVRREDFIATLLESDRTERSIFKTILNLHASLISLENTIIGEKSPSHVYHVKTILDWFPRSKIIHIIRDPRAVLISRLNRKKDLVLNIQYSTPPWKYFKFFLFFFGVIHVTASWHRSASLHYKYNRLYPDNYTLIKYEDLICEPEPTIQQLCVFLEIPFDQNMLTQKVVGSCYNQSYTGPNGFDIKLINKWRSTIKPWMKKWTELFNYRYMRKLDYL
jgi:hypothetical protein